MATGPVRQAERGQPAGVADRRARAHGLGPDQVPCARDAAALGLKGRAAAAYSSCLNAATDRRRLEGESLVKLRERSGTEAGALAAAALTPPCHRRGPGIAAALSRPVSP